MSSSTDVTELIITTINEIFSKLFTSINNSLYDILDNLIFISTDILNNNNLSSFLGTSASNGMLLISNSLLIGFLLYYAAKYLFSHLTYSPSEQPLSFLFKLLLCGIGMNFSFFLLDAFILILSSISFAVIEIGENLLHTTISFSSLIDTINFTSDTSSFDIFSLDRYYTKHVSIFFVKFNFHIFNALYYDADFHSTYTIFNFIFIYSIQ